MTATSITTLYPLIQPFVKRVDVPAMNTAIIQVARDFCLRTKFRRVSPPPQNINASQRVYNLTGGNADEEVVLIQAAQYTDSGGFNHTLTPISPEEAVDLPNNLSGGQCPWGFWLMPPSQIALHPVPTQTYLNSLLVRCVLQPVSTAMNIDSAVLQQHDTTIAHGAIAWLKGQNDVSWSDPRGMEEWTAKYERGVGKGLNDSAFQFKQWNTASRTYRF
jgi:hypothetical protein